jgi:hypothetical protein
MPLKIETSDQYHAAPGFSKSRLWRYHTLTPYRAEFGKITPKPQFDIGHAAHTAILEPELLESTTVKGPDDRRGKKWSDLHEEVTSEGKILLTASDYDLAMMIRDAADTVEELQLIRKGALIERSCYAEDEEHGVTVKCRPDVCNPGLGIMGDIKNMADISDDAWSRDIGKWGFAMQHAMYLDVWNQNSHIEADDTKSEFYNVNLVCDSFFFICFSKTEPVEVICRELEPVDIDEGYKSYRAALALAAECHRNQEWPGQPKGVVRGVKMRDRDRRYTPPQWRKDMEDEE